jgi:hypothetical protein
MLKIMGQGRRSFLAGLAAAVLAAGTASAASDAVPPSPADLRWKAFPLAVFADQPDDPRVARQLALLEERKDELDALGVVVIVDTDPAAPTEWRTKLRPRDFTFVLLDLEGRVAYRKPSPVPAREIIRLIARMDMVR